MSASTVLLNLISALGEAWRAAPHVESYTTGGVTLEEGNGTVTGEAAEQLRCYLLEAEREVVAENIQEIRTRAEAKLKAIIDQADAAATEAGTPPPV